MTLQWCVSQAGHVGWWSPNAHEDPNEWDGQCHINWRFFRWPYGSLSTNGLPQTLIVFPCFSPLKPPFWMDNPLLKCQDRCSSRCHSPKPSRHGNGKNTRRSGGWQISWWWVMMNKLLWGLQKHGIYVCVYIYTHLLYLVRWGLQDAGTRKNSAAKKIVYIYICISLHLLYAYIPYIIYTHSSIKPRTSLGTWERCWTGSSFLDADSRSCSCTTASWFPSRGTSRRRPIRSTVDWSGVVEPIKKIGDKTVASDFRRF